MQTCRIMCALILVAVLLSGCTGADPKNELADIKRKNRMIHARYTGHIDKLRKQISHLKRANDKLKEGRYVEEKKVFDEYPDIPGIQEREGELVVLMTADILFDPGKSRLKPSAKVVLDQLGSALNNDLFRGKAIRIEGHTDSDPIKRAKEQYSSNWELGSARARSVMSYLIGKGGLDPSERTIYTSSYSKYRPLVPNKTRSGKAQNRRVEVVVIMGKGAY